MGCADITTRDCQRFDGILEDPDIAGIGVSCPWLDFYLELTVEFSLDSLDLSDYYCSLDRSFFDGISP